MNAPASSSAIAKDRAFILNLELTAAKEEGIVGSQATSLTDQEVSELFDTTHAPMTLALLYQTCTTLAPKGKAASVYDALVKNLESSNLLTAGTVSALPAWVTHGERISGAQNFDTWASGWLKSNGVSLPAGTTASSIFTANMNAALKGKSLVPSSASNAVSLSAVNSLFTQIGAQLSTDSSSRTKTPAANTNKTTPAQTPAQISAAAAAKITALKTVIANFNAYLPGWAKGLYQKAGGDAAVNALITQLQTAITKNPNAANVATLKQQLGQLQQLKTAVDTDIKSPPKKPTTPPPVSNAPKPPDLSTLFTPAQLASLKQSLGPFGFLAFVLGTLLDALLTDMGNRATDMGNTKGNAAQSTGYGAESAFIQNDTQTINIISSALTATMGTGRYFAELAKGG